MSDILSLYKNEHLLEDYSIKDFVNPFVKLTIKKIKEKLEDSFEFDSKLFSSIEQSCKDELLTYTVKMLITEHKVYEIENDLSINMADFIKVIFHDSMIIKSLENIYPFLFDFLLHQTMQIANAYIEILNRVDKNIESLVECELIKNNEFLKGVNRGEGDGHNGNRKVTELIFSEGSRIYYKPKNSNLTLILFEIQQWVENHSNLEFKRYKILNRENYSFEQKIDHVQLKNKNDIEEYFYNFGVNMGLVYLLNGSDYHFENIIAHKTFPVMIDNETLFNPSISKIDTSQHLVNMGMLPNMSLEYDISSLSGSYDSQSIEVEQLSFENNNYLFKTKPFHIDRQKNIINNDIDFKYIYNNEKINILSGFNELIRTFLTNKNDFLSSGILDKVKKEEIRLVIRPSKMYAEVLQKLTHPYHIKTKNTVYDFLTKSLYNNNYEKEFLESEKAQLINGDIPIFHLRGDNIYLKEMSTTSFCQLSPYEAAIDKINSLNSQHLLLCNKYILNILEKAYNYYINNQNI